MDNGNRTGSSSHASHHHSGSHHRNRRTDESEIFKMHVADIPATQETHVEGADDCAEHPRRAGHCGVCPRERYVGRRV